MMYSTTVSDVGAWRQIRNMVKSIPLRMLKIGWDMQRVWPHFCREVFLYDDWNKDTLQVMMAHNQVPQNAISTRVGSLECITIYSPRLENFMCHRIYSKWRENWNEKAQASTYH